MPIDAQRLSEIRSGQQGLGLALYIDVDEDEWEDYSLTLPTVIALDKDGGRRVLDAIRAALDSGTGEEIADLASEALSILLASNEQEQLAVADFLEDLGPGVRTPLRGFATAG